MKTIEVKRVDLWDGGERHNFGFYIDADVTDETILTVYPKSFIRSEVITVFDYIEEVEENSIKNLRKSAWNKLTPQERQAIGLKEST